MSLALNNWAQQKTYLVMFLKFFFFYIFFIKANVVNTHFDAIQIHLNCIDKSMQFKAGPGGSVGYAVQLETRRSRVQPPPRSATFFCGD